MLPGVYVGIILNWVHLLSHPNSRRFGENPTKVWNVHVVHVVLMLCIAFLQSAVWSCGWGHGDVRRRLMGCGAWTGNWPLWAATLHLVGSGGGRAGALPYGGAGSCAPHLSCWSQISDWCSRCKRDSCKSWKHHFSPLWSLKSMMQLSRFNLFHALPLYNSSISSRKTSNLTRSSFCIPFYLLVEIAWIVAASLSRIW